MSTARPPLRCLLSFLSVEHPRGMAHDDYRPAEEIVCRARQRDCRVDKRSAGDASRMEVKVEDIKDHRRLPQ